MMMAYAARRTGGVLPPPPAGEGWGEGVSAGENRRENPQENPQEERALTRAFGATSLASGRGEASLPLGLHPDAQKLQE